MNESLEDSQNHFKPFPSNGVFAATLSSKHSELGDNHDVPEKLAKKLPSADNNEVTIRVKSDLIHIDKQPIDMEGGYHHRRVNNTGVESPPTHKDIGSRCSGKYNTESIYKSRK